MCRNASRLIAVVFAFAALMAIAQPVQACYYQCQFVAPLCKRCVYAGGYTGVYCQDVGTCGCRFQQGQCFAAVGEGPELPDFFDSEPVFTPAQPAPDGEQPATTLDLEPVLAAD